jgi:hypothetical protein
VISIRLNQFNTDRQNILVAMPLYKQVPVSWFLSWSAMDKSRCTELLALEGVYLPRAMDQLVRAALKRPDWEFLVSFEHDMIVPTDAFDRVASYPDHCDIVSATYFEHGKPYGLMAWERLDGVFHQFTPARARYVLSDPGLHEVDGVPMGFTAIRRRVLEEWDDSSMWHSDQRTHDLQFCLEAKRQGRSIYLDTALRCGHLSEVSIDYANFLGEQ